MTINPSSNENNGGKSGDRGTASDPATAEEYKVGYGHPPKEHQFKKGRSGNPKGRKPKKPPIELDLKRALEQALNTTVKLKQNEKERIVTMAIAGIEQLVAQYAKGDHRARRDLIALADKLGVDLIAGQHKAIREAAADAPAASSAYTLSDAVLDRLSPSTLNEIRKVVEEVEAEETNLKKMH